MSALIENKISGHQRALGRILYDLGKDQSASAWLKALQHALNRQTTEFANAYQTVLKLMEAVLKSQASDRQILDGAIIPLVALRIGADALNEQELASQCTRLFDNLIDNLPYEDPFFDAIRKDLRAIGQLPEQLAIRQLQEDPTKLRVKTLLAEGKTYGAWQEFRRAAGDAPQFASLVAEVIDRCHISAPDFFASMKGRTENMPHRVVEAIAEVTAVRLTKDGSSASAYACISFVQDPSARALLSKVVALGIAANAVATLQRKL
jgi:hypothetical protein